MRLPSRESAYVPEPKLDGYLLSENHPVGRAKARLLRALGYDDTNVNLLEQGLLAVAHQQPVAEVVESEYGVNISSTVYSKHRAGRRYNFEQYGS